MSAENIKALFKQSGISISEWARLNGFSTGLVYQILDGHRKCSSGQSHKIAVALKLKQGEVVNMQEFNEKLGQMIASKSEMRP